MNQEEREVLTQQTTARILACLHQTTGAEEMICSMLTSYGREMFAAGGRNLEEWISCTVAGLPIPMLITRTTPEASGEQEPIVAYHWQTLDQEGNGVTFVYCLEQALTSVMQQQRQS
jgi:hypothetical protein